MSEEVIVKSKIILIINLIFIAFLCQSCGTKIIYMKQLELKGGGSFFKQIESLTFGINQFDDRRAIKDVVGYHPARYIVTKKEVTDIIAQAIATELKRNGHKVLESNSSDKGDVVIDGIVRKFFFKWRTGWVFAYCEANVEVDIKVTTPLVSNKMFSKKYTGYYKMKEFGGSFRLIRIVLNEALLNMIKDFTTDQDLFDYLHEVEKNH